MENVIYERTLESRREDDYRMKIVLTKEVNRLVLWQIISEGEESDKYVVVANWWEHDQSEAINFAVDYAATREKSRAESLVSRIVRIVSGKQWNSDVLDRIVQELRASGYTILDWDSREG